MLGWCPASYLVPVEEDDIDGEKEENDAIIGNEKGQFLTEDPLMNLLSVFSCYSWCSLY